MSFGLNLVHMRHVGDMPFLFGRNWRRKRRRRIGKFFAHFADGELSSSSWLRLPHNPQAEKFDDNDDNENREKFSFLSTVGLSSACCRLCCRFRYPIIGKLSGLPVCGSNGGSREAFAILLTD